MGKFSFPNYECSVSFWTKIYMLSIGLSVYVVQVKINTYYIHSVVVQDCIRSSLLCEPVSLRVAIATSCDAVSSRNRQDLIHTHSLVPPHYVCNKFI